MRAILAASVAAAFLLSPTAFAQSDDSVCIEARLSLSDGETAAAIEQFSECLDTQELTPDQEVQTYAGLGAAHLARDDWSGALSAFNFAFAIADTNDAEISNAALWRNRGIARAQLDMTENALADLRQAARMAPDDILTHLNLGIVYQDLERPADAVVAFDRVVRLEPDWVGAWLNRSGAFLDVGMTQAAVEDARRAVELDPESGSTLNMLCWTLIQDGRAQIALPLCEQAVAAEPEIGAIVHSLAAALEAVDRLDEALPLYQRAYRLSPEDPEITADYERTHNP